MNRPLVSLTLAALLAVPFVHAQEKSAVAPAPASAKPAAPAKPASQLPPQPPDVAAPKLGPDGQPNAGFIAAHERFVKIAQEGKAQLIFLGDSITAGWGGPKAKPIWDTAFGAYQPANFGISGDRTQHVPWRIENGELDGIKPKVVVLMIGTNNTGDDSAEGIAAGVTKIVEMIEKKSPATKVLLLAIFPRGENPNPAREKIKEVNAIIAKLEDDRHVFFSDIGSNFLQPDDTLTKEIMPDFLHLSEAGYLIWAEAIRPKLEKLMK